MSTKARTRSRSSRVLLFVAQILLFSEPGTPLVKRELFSFSSIWELLRATHFDLRVRVLKGKLDFDEISPTVWGPQVMIGLGHTNGLKHIGDFLLGISFLGICPAPNDDVKTPFFVPAVGYELRGLLGEAGPLFMFRGGVRLLFRSFEVS